MKYFLIFLFLIGFLGSFLFVTNAYALWLPLSPEDLIEQSETIFVGTVTAITPVDVEYQSQVARNGTIKESIGPEVIALDEYTVNVEEYLKNPQDSNTVTVLQTTVPGVPGSPAKIGGFEIGDRVLFYLPEEYATKSSRQYLPESFELPEQCDGKDVLMQKRLYGDKEFTIRQDGIEFDGFKKKEYLNFTANTDPIQFVYGYDTKTMAGKTVDIDLVISKLDSNGVVHKTVFNQTIKAESKPCEWIAHADWEFVPKESGSYQVTGIAKNIDDHHSLELIIGSLIDVSATPKSSMSPLQQFMSGVPINEIQCKEGLEIILKLSNGSPACVTPQTKQKLIQRGWMEVVLPSIGSTTRTERQDIPITYDGPTDIPSANNQFALRFYSHILQDNKEGNIFFSPTSILTAFAIAYEGAQGNTATEMEQVFGFEPEDSARHEDFANMQQRLNFEGQNNTLSIANALWLAKNFEPYEDYVNNVENYYSGKVESVDFASKEKSLDIINQWVHDNTGGKIEKIFETLDPGTKLAITNAIYFKGIWEEPFEKDRTATASFHVGDGLTVSVPMMELKTTYLNQAKTPTARILELPYEGNKISMLILLPNEIDGIHALEDSLSTQNISAWQEDYTKIKTKAYIPKFKLETDYDLIPPLVDLGVRDAFGNANFSGISELDLFIYKATHKALIEVNEEGTEAAAATGMATLESGPVEFRADHPFVFVIQDNETGQILFMGRVVDPTK